MNLEYSGLYYTFLDTWGGWFPGRLKRYPGFELSETIHTHRNWHTYVCACMRVVGLVAVVWRILAMAVLIIHRMCIAHLLVFLRGPKVGPPKPECSISSLSPSRNVRFTHKSWSINQKQSHPIPVPNCEPLANSGWAYRAITRDILI